MKRFEAVSPMDFRYVAEDSELLVKVYEYKDLDVYTKLNRVVPESVIPRLNSLEEELLDIGNKNNGQVPRRIDGQHEGMISIKEIFTGYAQRLRKRTGDIQKVPLNLDKIKEPERSDRISDLVYFFVSTLSVEANIGNDIRHQFRDEIKEYQHREYPITRIGSSAMPHKKNPVEYEKIVSFWKAYLPRVVSSLMSQINEHQGDSTNEDMPYFSFEMACALSYSTNSLKNSLKNLQINVK